MIRAQNFSCSLPVRGVVLRDLSFDLGPGITAVVGPTGAGTSTLLRASAGLLPGASAVRGRLHVAGLAATHATPGELAGKVRLVSPTGLGASTAEELLTAWLPASNVRAALVELGLERWRDRPVVTLPPDVRSSLCLAQLRHGRMPDVVAIDQVLTPCRPEAKAALLAEARRLADSGRCVLWADHGIDELWQVADRFLELDHGELVAEAAVADWMPVTVREPALLVMARALGLPAAEHRTAESLLPAAREVLPRTAATSRGQYRLLDPIRVGHQVLGLRGDGELQLGRDETLGIVDISGRGEGLARRLTQVLRGAVALPTTLPSDVPVKELVKSWEKATGMDPGSVLRAPGTTGLRPGAILAHHGSGDAANLRVAMAESCPLPLWLPHPQAMLDPRRASELAGHLRRPQPAPRLLTSRDHDFLLAACHRLLVCDGDAVVAIAAPEAALRHLPHPPLLARATGSEVVRLEQLLGPLAKVVAA